MQCAVALALLSACAASQTNPADDPDAALSVTLLDGGGVPDANGTPDGGWAPVAPQVADAMLAQLENGVQDLGLVGAAMGVAYADQRWLWSGARGLAKVEDSQPWEAGRSFRIGSVTKTFTAALVFLLVEDGLVRLDDPLEQWLPGYYDGVGVTVRHLLSNTSGIVSYNYVGNFDSSASWQPEALVQWAVDHEQVLRFPPGSQWEYSNTNFVLLGLIIEGATGQRYADVVQARLTGPLGLGHTYMALSGDANPAIVDCYAVDGTNLSGTADPSFGWAAGAGVSTPSDLARWAAALYGGEVLSPASLNQMLTPTQLTDGSTVEYGMGAFLEIDGENAIFGHTGGIAGYFTYMYFWRADRIALVMMSNRYQTNLRTLAGYGWSVPLDFPFP